MTKTNVALDAIARQTARRNDEVAQRAVITENRTDVVVQQFRARLAQAAEKLHEEIAVHANCGESQFIIWYCNMSDADKSPDRSCITKAMNEVAAARDVDGMNILRSVLTEHLVQHYDGQVVLVAVTMGTCPRAKLAWGPGRDLVTFNIS